MQVAHQRTRRLHVANKGFFVVVVVVVVSEYLCLRSLNS